MKRIVTLIAIISCCAAYGQDDLAGTWNMPMPANGRGDLLRTHETTSYQKETVKLEDGCYYQLKITKGEEYFYFSTQEYCQSSSSGTWDAFTEGTLIPNGDQLILSIEEYNSETKEFLSLQLTFKIERSGDSMTLTQL